MSYVPRFKRMEPITLGERFELDQISTRAKTLSPTKSYAEKPYNWEEGDWWDLDDQSVGNTKILEDFEITEEMRRRPNVDGGRIGFKRGTTLASQKSVEEYVNIVRNMIKDSKYVPTANINFKETGRIPNFLKAKEIVKAEVGESFETLFNKNINKRKKLKRAADPEKRLSDLVSKQMRKAKKRFKEIGKISLSKADLTFNRAQNTVLKLANELINSNPDAILKDKALLDKISYRIDNNGNIIKIKPDLTKLIDPKADARFFHLGHGKRVELGGELLNVPANRNAVPFSLNMDFTKDAEKFIEANHNKPEMKSKIDKIIAKAKELKIQLRPDVPKGTFKNASGNPIRFIGYQHNAHPILKVLDVVKTYMPKGLRAPGRLKIPAAILALTTTSAKADSLEPSDKKQEASVLPAVIKDHPYLSSAAAVTAAAPKKTWEAVKWGAKKLTPLLTPAASHVLHGGKYDLTSGTDLMAPAFWKHGIDAMNARSRWGNQMIGLKKRLRDIALRGGLPTRFLPIISGTASAAMGPLLIKDAAEWLQSRIDKQGLTGMIADQSGIISDEAGGSLFMEDVVEEKKRKDAEGMDYATGGIASLIK